MVGGSQIIDQLTNKSGSLLFELMGEIGIDWDNPDHCRVLTAAAGGARIWIKDETQARALIKYWPLVASTHAPGVEVLQVLVRAGNNWATTLSEAEKKLVIQRNRAFPRLPQAGPMVARVPRTGEAAVSYEDREWLDIQQVRKRAAIDQPGKYASENSPFNLARKIVEYLGDDDEEHHWNPNQWPLDFSDIAAGDGERSYLALVHADGNSLGQSWIDILEKAKGYGDNRELAGIYADYSNLIEQTSLHALASAVQEILLGNQGQKKFPLRPILCAGDDMTMVIRADLALRFTRDYLDSFEKESVKRLKELARRWPILGKVLPESIRAAAGIAFIKERFPFAQGYALCESLCSYVKKTSRDHSGLAFHRVTTSATQSYEELLRSELSSRTDMDGERRLLSFNPYFLNLIPPQSGCASVEQLLAAVEASTALPRGPLRESASEAVISKELADIRIQRLREVTIGRSGKEIWESFENIIRNMTGAQDEKSFIWQKRDSRWRTPLNDILELKALRRFEKVDNP